MNTYGFHTIHGRAGHRHRPARRAPRPQGVRGDRRRRRPVDRGNHMLHLLRRNVNLTLLLFNNRSTAHEGAVLPDERAGKVTKSPRWARPTAREPARIRARLRRDVRGAHDRPQHPAHGEVLKRAAAHKGTASSRSSRTATCTTIWPGTSSRQDLEAGLRAPARATAGRCSTGRPTPRRP